jgi:hypothetical protein
MNGKNKFKVSKNKPLRPGFQLPAQAVVGLRPRLQASSSFRPPKKNIIKKIKIDSSSQILG